MSILSWLSNAFAPPEAFMTRPGLNGAQVRLYWARPFTPLDIYWEGGPESIFQPAYLAVDFWNQQLGRRLFREPFPAELFMLEAFQDPEVRAGLKGQILVRVDGSESDHGSTDLRYDERTGEMLNAIVILPAKSRRPVDVAAHELGHALALDHSADGLMVAHLPAPGYQLPLAGYQLRALKGMVG